MPHGPVEITERDGVVYTARDHDTVQNGAIIEATFAHSGVTTMAAMIFAEGHPARGNPDPQKPYAVLLGMGGPPPVYQNPNWQQRETVSDKLEEVAGKWHHRVGAARAKHGYFVQLNPNDEDVQDYERDEAMAAVIADPEIERVLMDSGMDGDFDPFDWTSIAHVDYALADALKAWAEETDDANLDDLITDDCRFRESPSPDIGFTRLDNQNAEDALEIVKTLNSRWANGRPRDLVERIQDRIADRTPAPSFT